MIAFNVGDRVIVTTERHGKEQYGGMGTISNIEDSELRYHVEFDIGWWQKTNSYSASDLELIKEVDILGDDDSDCI